MVMGKRRRKKSGCLVESTQMSDVSCWAPSQLQIILDFILEIVKFSRIYPHSGKVGISAGRERLTE
jgi:hypothetical protein